MRRSLCCPLCMLSSAQLSSARLGSAQLNSAQALCQATLTMTFSVLIDKINMFHLDIDNSENASKALMFWLSLGSCRSPIRRISEVMLLVFVTSSLWFLVAYASPCKDLPPKVSAALYTTAACHSCLQVSATCEWPARVWLIISMRDIAAHLPMIDLHPFLLTPSVEAIGLYGLVLGTGCVLAGCPNCCCLTHMCATADSANF